MPTIIKIVRYGDENDPRYRVERVEPGLRQFLDYGLSGLDEARGCAVDAARRLGADLEEARPIRLKKGEVAGWALAPSPW